MVGPLSCVVHLVFLSLALRLLPPRMTDCLTKGVKAYNSVKEERRTRGHGVTLAKKQCRLDIIIFLFSKGTVNEWNRLSADCVGASSVNIFKNKIDIYLRRAGYT